MKSVARAVFGGLRSSDGFLLQSAAWILLGGFAYLNRGFWLYATVPLFGVAAVCVKVIWKRTRRR